MKYRKVVQSWRNMHDRCYNEKHVYYFRYGGKGILVCERWHKFINFHSDLYSSWFEGATLDRINGELGYYPENCRWATRDEQAQNSKNTTMNWDKIREIRKLYAEKKYNQYQLADLFGVTQASISMIILQRVWKDVQKL